MSAKRRPDPDGYVERLRGAATGPAGRLIEARARLAEEQARLKEIERLEKSGQLGDVAEFERVSFESARADRDAWMNWPQRIAAQLAAELGVDTVVVAVALERYVREHLEERSRVHLEAAGKEG